MDYSYMTRTSKSGQVKNAGSILQDLEQFLRKVYGDCKSMIMSVSELLADADSRLLSVDKVQREKSDHETIYQEIDQKRKSHK